MTHPTHGLLGKPFKWQGRGPDGYDCYGLVVEIYRRRGIEVLDWESPDEEFNSAALNFWGSEVLNHSNWFETEKGPDVAVLFAAPGDMPHCGYMLDYNRFIHCSSTTGRVCIERLSDPRWAGRIKGFYDCA